LEPSLAATLGLAFGLGLLHALDADHVMAVSALASRRPGLREALGFCARWAVGHALAVLVLGGLVLLLGARLPDWVSDSAEQLVGVVLIGLGAWVLWDLRRRRIHVHVHAHEGVPRHAHWHLHSPSESRAVDHLSEEHGHDHGAVLVGLLHGTAGSAPVLALMPLAQQATPLWGVVYLVLFSVGVLFSMLLFAGVLGLCFERLARSGPGWLDGVRAAVGLATIGFGLLWL